MTAVASPLFSVVVSSGGIMDDMAYLGAHPKPIKKFAASTFP